MKSFFTFISFSMLAIFCSACNAQSKYYLAIGTYTKTQQNGIFVYQFDPKSGSLEFISKTQQISNPSFLIFNKNQSKVYAVGEEQEGLVYAFDFNKKLGTLTLLNQQETKGAHPCYITLSQDEKNLFVANYSSGNLSCFPIDSKGEIGSLNQLIQHTGKSIRPQQKSAHAHSIVNKPNSNEYLSADLGTDKIFRYTYSPDTEKALSPYHNQEFVTLEKGAGPRHIAFNKTNTVCYIVNELDATVSVLDIKTDQFKQIQRVQMNDADFSGTNGAADIHLSRDGKFLYASNRGSANEIVIFSVNTNNGELTKIGSQKSLGVGPRNFAIDPTDNFLLVANQNSDDVFVFKRNKNTGLLSYTNHKINIGSPVCLAFASK